MKTLHVIISNKVATYLQRDGYIVCGNSDNQIEFTFDDEWDAYERKTARFIWNGKYKDVEFEGTLCPVPIVANTEQLEVGVYVEDLSTTTSAVIPCRLSVLCHSDIKSDGKVVIPGIPDSSDATAWSGAILEPETAYVKGEKLTGTMPNNGYTGGDFSATLDANFPRLELFGAYNGAVEIHPEKITATKNGTYKSSAGSVITEVEVAVEGDSAWCGEYRGGSYLTGAIVSYNGNVYICIKDTDDEQEPTDTEYWEMLNEEGEGESSWCGEYIDGTGYKKDAIVSYNGNIYICIKDLDDMQEPTNAEYWEMLNEEGIDTSGLTATADKVLADEIFVGVNGKETGTMENNGYGVGDFTHTLDVDNPRLELNGAYGGEVHITLEEKTVTANGTYEATDGKVISKVTVAVPSEEPNLISKTITENGTYKASAEGEDELAGTWVLNTTINPLSSAARFYLNGTFNGCMADSGTFATDLEFNDFWVNSGTPYAFVISGVDTFYASDLEDYENISNQFYRSADSYVACHYQVGGYNYYSPTSENGVLARTFTITSKLSEVTNGSTLLAWLKANATKQPIPAVDGYSEVVVNVEPELEEITITENGEYTPSGDGYSKVIVAVPSETVDEWDGTGVVVEAIASASLITFTIAGTSYQAEEGMTWAEWCESDYNTANASVSGSLIKIGGKYISESNGAQAVYTTTTIINGYAYTLPEMGSG